MTASNSSKVLSPEAFFISGTHMRKVEPIDITAFVPVILVKRIGFLVSPERGLIGLNFLLFWCVYGSMYDEIVLVRREWAVSEAFVSVLFWYGVVSNFSVPDETCLATFKPLSARLSLSNKSCVFLGTWTVLIPTAHLISDVPNMGCTQYKKCISKVSTAIARM